MRNRFIVWFLLLTFSAYGHESQDFNQYYQHHSLARNLIAIVAEGEEEPRSVGSYSIRIYEVYDPQTPFDNFVSGVVRFRDGSISDVRITDIGNKGTKEIIVEMQVAGSGGYVSADVFRYKNRKLLLRRHEEGSRTGIVSRLRSFLRK